MNKVNANMSSLSRSSAEAVSEFISSAFKNFGFSTFGVVVPEEVSALVEERELLRANKQFTQSDDLRNKILELGYEVEDTPSGPLVRAKE